MNFQFLGLVYVGFLLTLYFAGLESVLQTMIATICGSLN